MVRPILTRLKFDNKFIDDVTTVVEHHMDHRCAREMKKSTFKKFISRPTFDLEMALHYRDVGASNCDFSTYEYILERRASMPVEQIKPVPLLNGRDLINLGYKPGVLFKELLVLAYDAQLEGQVTDKEQAIELVTKYHKGIKNEN